MFFLLSKNKKQASPPMGEKLAHWVVVNVSYFYVTHLSDLER
ncbi:hypothetical protein LMG8520_2061 [Lactococcus lactis subsp. lactis]|uniref:Uncharacterized protein n=1 Tax=Lactococcus lactis subsp. lactis TaxID=1360 RepID=A0A0V8AYD8_LACLL|nr:hypothetical protein LK337_2287 [Lactococcus lactis subsp. lactis]KSU01275.1 hypothetical protein KF201_1727 [Lactococcus lactis subsp. lactis]KSU06594.1 hypothetical protein LMG8520_2061 [Lactococcus lactis subsp. lactis]